MSDDQRLQAREKRLLEIKSRAHGHWTSILRALGVDEKILNGKNQPCPLVSECGAPRRVVGGRQVNVDRFQYTDKFGEGNYHCRHCGTGGGLKLAQGVLGIPFPELLDRLGVSNDVAGGSIPDTVRYSFWFGGAALLAAVLWTVLTTREYSPEEMARFAEANTEAEATTINALAGRSLATSILWIALGVAVILAVVELGQQDLGHRVSHAPRCGTTMRWISCVIASSRSRRL